MNWEQVEGRWKDFKGQLRAKWGKLTDDDFEVIAGKKDRLLGKLQERYGYQKDNAEQQLDEMLASIEQDNKKAAELSKH